MYSNKLLGKNLFFLTLQRSFIISAYFVSNITKRRNVLKFFLFLVENNDCACNEGSVIKGFIMGNEIFAQIIGLNVVQNLTSEMK